MSYQIELRHFKYFKVLAEELKFRTAAEKLFISQPGLTRQIKQMEEILKVSLFDRNKRKVELTKAGVYLKQEVDFMFNHLEVVAKELESIGSGKQGELRIGFLGSAAQNVLPELILKINDLYPGMQTLLEEMPNRMQVDYMLKDKLDLGFVRLQRVPQEIARHAVLKDTFSLVLPEAHPIDVDHFENLRQFSAESFIFFSSEDSPEYHDLIMGICEDSGFSPQVFHKSVDALTIFRLVEQGLGVAIVPTSLQYGYNLKIKFIELTDIPQRTELSVIWKKSSRNPALQQVVMLFIH